MKAYKFPAKVTNEGKIEFPDTLLKYLAANQEIRVDDWAQVRDRIQQIWSFI